MKREQQRLFKQLDKELSDIINKYSKQYKFKKKDIRTWKAIYLSFFAHKIKKANWKSRKYMLYYKKVAWKCRKKRRLYEKF